MKRKVKRHTMRVRKAVADGTILYVNMPYYDDDTNPFVIDADKLNMMHYVDGLYILEGKDPYNEWVRQNIERAKELGYYELLDWRRKD